MIFNIANPFSLKARGVVGMNKRNIDYIARNNPRRLYPIVDDKLKTKLQAEEFQIPSPKLLGVIECQKHVRQLPDFLREIGAGFVIKPARGSGGKGILIISHQEDGKFFKTSGKEVSDDEIQKHGSNILSGLYSLGGTPDVGVLEELVEFSDIFDGFTYEGVPDVRIICYKGYPAFAMTRLSTEVSDGKANLHQGAVGVGLDIATGKALRAVQFDKAVTHHPDTGTDLSELQVSNWPEIIELASRCYEMSQLGYLGVDVILDKHRGPMIIELNARPGLAIQIAHGFGMGKRIDRIEELYTPRHDYKERAEIAMKELAGIE
ncbi:alpha-L-glutamate ligase-like protein [Curvivirga sp.]|uniref:alpha-L-glutamate ligase-like protein n=1 Tax=Curvivirga sp. TaxID=2856848 RepID=UPI003B5C3228